MYGESQARPRIILVGTNFVSTKVSNMAPAFVFDVQFPAVIGEFLRNTDLTLGWEFTANPKHSVELNQPTALGWINLTRDNLTYGGEFRHRSLLGVCVSKSDRGAVGFDERGEF